MYTLYIDTHFVNLVLALFQDDVLLEQKILESNKHSENTIPLLEELLKKHSLFVSDLKEIIVIEGPGSFTGVRIGIVIAKVLGYSLHLPIKTLSYLEAMSLHYDEAVVLGIKDRNGVFVGEFDAKHRLQGDYYYLTNQELKCSNKKIIMDDYVDLNQIKEFVKSKESISPHLLKPLYVKKIEVEK